MKKPNISKTRKILRRLDANMLKERGTGSNQNISYFTLNKINQIEEWHGATNLNICICNEARTHLNGFRIVSDTYQTRIRIGHA